MPAPEHAADAFAEPRSLGEHKLSRWTLKDFATFEEWMRDRREKQARIVVFKANQERHISREQAVRILADLRIQPIGIGDILGEVASREGLVYAMWLGFRQNHPGIELDEVAEIEARQGTLRELTEWLIGLDVIPPADNDNPGDPDDPPAETGSSTSPES